MVLSNDTNRPCVKLFVSPLAFLAATCFVFDVI